MAAPPSLPTESRILTLEGHISGKDYIIKLEIDWLNKVGDLKESIKEKLKNTLKGFDAHQLILYKLGNNGVNYDGLDHSPPYDLDAYKDKFSCSLLKNHDSIYNCWPLDENGVPSNKKDRLHFLVVLPDTTQDSSTLIFSEDNSEVFIDNLAQDLREWCERIQASPTKEVETLQSLGEKFPLQQCDSIIRRLRAHMLDSFQFKFVWDDDWIKSFSIPIVGAASGTGKTAICSRFLDEMAVNFPSPSATYEETQDDHVLANTAQNNINAIQMIVADSEGHLPKPTELESLSLSDIWTEARLAGFRQKVITSAKRKLTLTVDFMASVFEFSTSSTLERDLAAALLDAYSKRFATDQTWQKPDDLIKKLARHSSPLHVALRVLRTLEGDNIIIIHLDETQAVPSKTLQTLVKLLVRQMHYYHREMVPWIFPILSGLSLESLLDCSTMSGAQVRRYTPPVLTISSMLNIIKAMFYTNDMADGQVKQPDFQKDFIRLLHDLRGPTRYFQAVLLYIQNFSGMVKAQQWHFRATINREAIRAGLEKPDQNWGDIFDLLSTLTDEGDFMKDLYALRKDPELLRRLFNLNLLGKPISVGETFIIKGKAEPVSTLFNYGWATIVDTTDETECTIFLPFLTLYGAATHDPYCRYHPGLTPLCKVMDWTIIEKEDARMLQYRLTQRSMSEMFDTHLSDLFGELGDVPDKQFCLSGACDFRTLQHRVQSHDDLSTLWSTQSTPTVYVNGALAKFADSFFFLPQPDSSLPHVLCMQSKFLQKRELTMKDLHQEYKMVADVCGNFPFTLVIPADRVAAKCWTSLATDAVLKSCVLVLNSAGFDAFYGKPLVFRRKILSRLVDLPEFRVEAPQEVAEPQAVVQREERNASATQTDQRKRKRNASSIHKT